jgi:ribonuclease HII
MKIPQNLPHLDYEIKLWSDGYTVIGIDEVGRGAFAGPLFVGGVAFKPDSNRHYLENLGINDSKKLKPNARKLLSKIIQKECLAYHISTVEVAKINRIGIGKATNFAMRQVVKNLNETITADRKFVLIDGFYVKHIKNIGLKNQKGIIRGDSISLSIAAASIIAKVARDDYMKKFAKDFPAYGWGKNKGYGTLQHRLALKNLGATPLHRMDFVENFIRQTSSL